MKNHSKPKVKLVLDKSRVILTLTPAIDALVKLGRREDALNLINEISKAQSYEEIIRIVKKYIDVEYDK